MKRIGANLERAALMGKPSIGARYERADYRSHRLEEGARCCFCGRPATDAHHVVPRSAMRSLEADTPAGPVTCLSPLFALCRRCHDDVHARARYRVVWEWRERRYAEEWESGHTLAFVYPPGSPWLFQQGRYRVIDAESGREFTLGA